VLCGWSDGDDGLSHVSWVNAPDGGGTFAATVGFADSRNVLRFRKSADMDETFAAAAAEAAHTCLDAHRDTCPGGLADIDLIIAAPPRPGFAAALSDRLGLPAGLVAVADDDGMHTAALAAAFLEHAGRLPAGTRILFVAAGAGVVAGSALYRQPPHGEGLPGQV